MPYHPGDQELPPGEPVPVGPFDPAGQSPQRTVAMLFLLVGGFVAIMGVTALAYFSSPSSTPAPAASTTTTQP
jgi:hypothetical protein